MSASTRFLEALLRLETSFFRWIGVNGHSPALVCNTIQTPEVTRHHNHDRQGSSVIESIFDSRLWAVPKFRRSLERRMTRRMGGEKHFETYGQPKNNIVACLECGHWHEKHTICGHCYAKVREETKHMQEAMGEEANFYAPQKEVAFLYEGEKDENSQEKFVVHLKKRRPEWFSKSLTSKQPSSDPS
ncbi:large ribosomal subunit protein bL32m-like [Liolophura sinensis]|uniref:large ribosomal subunit protein bL32m-like n=1 Tax=Liolophura sinensis TaxID=3198878 RepID=UPI0031582E32